MVYTKCSEVVGILCLTRQLYTFSTVLMIATPATTSLSRGIIIYTIFNFNPVPHNENVRQSKCLP